MTLFDEIFKKESDILDRSSVREKLFYYFLTDKKLNSSINIPEGEIDKVCYAAFADSRIDVSKELQRSLNAAPVKGLHFSNNLLSLTAFSIISEEARKKFLNSYFTDCSLAHQFILTKVFPELSLSTSPKLATDFDKLILEVFVNKEYTNGELLLISGLEKVNDLLELYILRASYFEIIKVHPNTETSNNLKELAFSFQMIIDASKRRIDSYVNVTILIVAFSLIFGIPYFISKKWAAWDLEPYITGIQISIGIFWFAVMILFNSNPDWFKVIQTFKNWLLRSSFERKHIALARVTEIIAKTGITNAENQNRTNLKFLSKLNWRVILIGILIPLSVLIYWYFDIGHKPVEKVDILIGNNYDFAEKLFFHSVADETRTYKLNEAKGEFRGIIQRHSKIIKDSIIQEYTWKFSRYNITIWVGKTANLDHQIIDALRWEKGVKF